MLDLAGEAVDDVNEAQNLARSGSVVISPAAWDMCNKPLCIARPVGNGFAQVRHSRLRGYSYLSSPTVQYFFSVVFSIP